MNTQQFYQCFSSQHYERLHVCFQSVGEVKTSVLHKHEVGRLLNSIVQLTS